MLNVRKQSLRFKGNLVPILTVQIFTDNLEKLISDITKKIKQAPKILLNAVIIIELKQEDHTNIENIIEFKNNLEKYGAIVVGIKPNKITNINDLMSSKIRIILVLVATEKLAMLEEDFNCRKTMTVRNIVRSGQQIYAENSDLIIIGTVSPGAEVAADGNISIYGNILGKAFAGVKGDNSSVIYSTSMSAEIIAIAGVYKTHEEINSCISNNKNIITSVSNNKLKFETI